MCHVSIKPSAAAVESGRRACTIGDLFSRVQCCTVASVWDVYPFTLRWCEIAPFQDGSRCEERNANLLEL